MTTLSSPRRSQFSIFSLLLLLLFPTTISSSSITFSNLEEVTEYLRSDDTRLIRPSPSSTTSERQNSIACDTYLQDSFSILTQASSPLDDKTTAAKVVTLCTTNNPTNRAKTWKYPKSVHQGLISMLSPEKPYAAAAAAEAIWISTFNSPENHAAFLHYNVLDALNTLLLSTCPNESNPCHYAIMWGAAALQNLLASYCDTPHGYCYWEWSNKKLMLHQDSPVKIDSEHVRQTLFQTYSELVTYLQGYVCFAEPIRKPHESETYPWPSRAEVSKDETSVTIVSWAVVGSLRNLALSSNILSKDTWECLCKFVSSPDWLESSKAEEALYRLGYSADEDCPKGYDENCVNMEGWKDEDGETCVRYEEEKWCVEWNWVKNEEGVKASEACCACGGGEVVEE